MHLMTVIGTNSGRQLKQLLFDVEGNDAVRIGKPHRHYHAAPFPASRRRGEIGKKRPFQGKVLFAHAGENDAFPGKQPAFIDVFLRDNQPGFSDFAQRGEAGIAVQIRLAAAEDDVENETNH